ncbi:hypothetical protein [Nocardia sp. alder85J]|uniref:hypothetical protein n=1 Tax=Nocardia sp. alder85J TaxID=2862949 RepID=UPI001CD56992|nr:hypothetical protein [Nocardia sp. alder85J]MCX4098238.1 hypothetical protein [Nocardia sp. alder85J]
MMRPVSRGLRRAAVLLSLALLALITAGPANAYAPVDIVHTERVQAGPYQLTVGFSTWPIRAMKSLDFTFMPDGGTAGKSGTLTIQGPAVRKGRATTTLVRHPRKRDAWGLDVRSLDAPGTYTFTFALDGPEGHGVGVLPAIQVLDQPGPPLAFSWVLGTLPLWGLLIFLAVVWRRTHPGARPLTV